MTKSSELVIRDNDVISNAPVSGNLHECGPLFIDEYSILLCASGSLIQAISSKTGELIGNFCGHSAAVTCIANCPFTSHDKGGENKTNMSTKSSPLVVSTSIDGCIIVWNKKTFKEVSRILTEFTLYEIVVPSTSKCQFLHGIQQSLDETSLESVPPHSEDATDGLYLVVSMPPAPKFKNPNQDQTAVDEKDTKKSWHKVENEYAVVLYKTKQKKVKRRIATIPGRQCAVSLGLILGDVYVASACVKSKLNFHSEFSNFAPQLHLNSGAASCLATVEGSGHKNGEITVFHDIAPWLKDSSSQRGRAMGAPPAFTTLHWHAHAVYSIALSPDAGYLFSGADEGVLVVWQLATGIKDFVPRLGAAITFLSSSAKEARVAITTGDNAVRIINTASMREDWELRALYIPRAEVSKYDIRNQVKSSLVEMDNSQVFVQADISYRCNIRIEGRSGCVACNGYPGQIQMLDLATQTFKASHEVVQFQRVTKKETYSHMTVPSTTQFNFLDTPMGSLMVTVDVRRGEESDAEASLKFWEWDCYRSKYRLSVQVDRPHGMAKVTAAVFSPSSSQTARVPQEGKAVAVAVQSSSLSFTCSCATSANDGSIKIWVGQSQQASTAKDSRGPASTATSMHWSCSFSFKHRDCPSGSLAYSFDGSLLAATYQNVVTLWDPIHVLLWKSIVIPSRNNITFTAFIEPRASALMGGGSGEAMLVVGSKRCLSVYNLITMKVMWSIEGYFSCFAVAPDESSVIRCDNSSSKSNTKQVAWIAASEKRWKNVKDISDPPNKIVLYGCYSSEPLCVQWSRPRVTSMTFWSNQKDLTSSLSSSVVALTAYGEVLIVGAADALKQHFSDRSLSLSTVPAKLLGVKVPALPFSAVVHSYNQSSSSSDFRPPPPPPRMGNLSSSVVLQQGSIALSKNWLGTIFDAKSGSIPPLSAIYDDFVGGLLNKQTGGRTFNATELAAPSAPKAPAAPPISSSTSNKVRVTEQSRVAGEAAKNVSFSEQRQAMFSGGLASFFSEFMLFNAGVPGDGAGAAPMAFSSPEALPAPTKVKSAAKGKKSEKRKADAL